MARRELGLGLRRYGSAVFGSRNIHVFRAFGASACSFGVYVIMTINPRPKLSTMFKSRLRGLGCRPASTLTDESYCFSAAVCLLWGPWFRLIRISTSISRNRLEELYASPRPFPKRMFTFDRSKVQVRRECHASSLLGSYC